MSNQLWRPSIGRNIHTNYVEAGSESQKEQQEQYQEEAELMEAELGGDEEEEHDR